MLSRPSPRNCLPVKYTVGRDAFFAPASLLYSANALSCRFPSLVPLSLCRRQFLAMKKERGEPDCAIASGEYHGKAVSISIAQPIYIQLHLFHPPARAPTSTGKRLKNKGVWGCSTDTPFARCMSFAYLPPHRVFFLVHLPSLAPPSFFLVLCRYSSSMSTSACTLC